MPNIKKEQQRFTFICNAIVLRPRIIQLDKLTEKLCQIMKTEGVEERKLSTKKHIARNSQTEFGPSMHFAKVSYKIVVYPSAYGCFVEFQFFEG